MSDFDDAMEKLDTLDGLRGLIENIDLRNRELEAKYNELDEKYEELKTEHEELGNLPTAVDEFLDLLDRPVGSLKFTVPEGDQVNRAILALFDAVGRNI